MGLWNKTFDSFLKFFQPYERAWRVGHENGSLSSQKLTLYNRAIIFPLFEFWFQKWYQMKDTKFLQWASFFWYFATYAFYIKNNFLSKGFLRFKKRGLNQTHCGIPQMAYFKVLNDRRNDCFLPQTFRLDVLRGKKMATQ